MYTKTRAMSQKKTYNHALLFHRHGSQILVGHMTMKNMSQQPSVYIVKFHENRKELWKLITPQYLLKDHTIIKLIHQQTG